MSSIPAVVSEAYPGLAVHPVIAEVFRPGSGWLTLRGLPLAVDRLVRGSYRKRITPSYARKLRREGVTAVSLDMGGGRRADFDIRELSRG